MTARAYRREGNLMGVMRNGTQNEFSVVGEPVAFYVFIAKGGRGDSCNWIKGNARLYQEFTALFENRKKRKFAELAERIFKENRR